MNKMLDFQTTYNELKKELKAKDYKKRGSYWYKIKDGFMICVNIQKSQWNPADYYINIGFALNNVSRPYPSELWWTGSHRCMENGDDRNVSMSCIMENLALIDNSKILTVDDMRTFLDNNETCRVNYGNLIIW